MDIHAKLDEAAKTFAASWALEAAGGAITPELDAQLNAVPARLDEVGKYVTDADAKVADLRAHLAELRKKAQARRERMTEHRAKAKMAARAARQQAATAPLKSDAEIAQVIDWLHQMVHPQPAAAPPSKPLVDEGSVTAMDAGDWAAPKAEVADEWPEELRTTSSKKRGKKKPDKKPPKPSDDDSIGKSG